MLYPPPPYLVSVGTAKVSSANDDEIFATVIFRFAYRLSKNVIIDYHYY